MKRNQTPASGSRPGSGSEVRGRDEKQERGTKKFASKKTKYGRQLEEKQKVKEIYGMRERQFRRFFSIARRSREATGELLLSLLEQRLDNVVYRLKMATTRQQARQAIVHGHVLVNGVKVTAPSYLISVNDEIGLSPRIEAKEAFISQVVEKRLNTNARVPDWLEIDKKAHKGRVLRLPVRADILVPIEEHLIVELYSK